MRKVGQRKPMVRRVPCSRTRRPESWCGGRPRASRVRRGRRRVRAGEREFGAEEREQSRRETGEGEEKQTGERGRRRSSDRAKSACDSVGEAASSSIMARGPARTINCVIVVLTTALYYRGVTDCCRSLHNCCVSTNAGTRCCHWEVVTLCRRRVLLMAAAILRYCVYVAITDVHDSSSCHASGREGAGGTGVAQWQQPGPGSWTTVQLTTLTLD